MIIGIAAVDRKGAIGKGGKLPWHYSADMKFFRETTTGHAVVMGRKTWLTIGKPLKNRLNIVLSRDSSIEPQGSLLAFTDIDSALSFSNSLPPGPERETPRRPSDRKPWKNRLSIVLSRDSSIEPQESLLVFSDIDSALSFSNSLATDLFVIGGAQIYEAFGQHIEKWIVTEVPLTVSGADAFMPKGYLDGFKVAESKSIGEDLVGTFYSR